MKSKTTQLAVVALLLGSVSVATADLAPFNPPPRPPSKENRDVDTANAVPFVMKVDRKSSVNRLIIPRKFAGKILGAGGGGFGQDGASDGAAASDGASRSMIAAIFLSLGVASIFLVRKRKPALAVGLGVMVVITGLGVYEYANANVPPPRFEEPRPVVQPLINAKQSVVIEIVDRGEAVELIRGVKRVTKEKPGAANPSFAPKFGPGAIFPNKGSANDGASQPRR